jgi:hypothetical protein
MRLKSHDDAREALVFRPLHHLFDKRLMSQVYTVKIPHGHHGGCNAFREFLVRN